MEPLTGASIPASDEPVAQRPPAPRTPLVATKLAPPPLPRHYRERARLSERLDAALHDATRLTLVSAPPGYGKSVAVAGWLASRGTPAAWLTLEPPDNDLVRFVRYLAAALRRVRPNAGPATLDLLATGASPAIDQLGATILEEIATSDEPFVLVLDDYQVISADPIHRLVDFLIRHGPPFAHPVLLTREDSPIPLARLRAHARLVELRAPELRYTTEEASTYLDGSMEVRLAPEPLEQLVDRTEGWIVGLQLAAVSLRDRPDPGAFVEALAGSRRAVFDYLAGEVMAGLEADLCSFLVRTSIADRLTPELCDERTAWPCTAPPSARRVRGRASFDDLEPALRKELAGRRDDAHEVRARHGVAARVAPHRVARSLLDHRLDHDRPPGSRRKSVIVGRTGSGAVG